MRASWRAAVGPLSVGTVLGMVVLNMVVLNMVLLGSLLLAATAHAAVYECRVTAVWSPLVLPERDYLARARPTLRLEDDGTHAAVTRCTRPPGAAEPTCERVEIDWVEQRAENGSRKYYRFATHYDLQFFLDRSFVENDGLGTVVHGRCKEVGE